jgi:hypothetical protein
MKPYLECLTQLKDIFFQLIVIDLTKQEGIHFSEMIKKEFMIRRRLSHAY